MFKSPRSTRMTIIIKNIFVMIKNFIIICRE